MSFSNLAANQMVSFAEAGTTGFSLQSGQAHVASNECMTKSQAFGKYVLGATANTNSLAANQLMQKSFWVTGLAATTIYISGGLVSKPAAGSACAIPNGVVRYVDIYPIVIGSSRLFMEATMVNPFSNSNIWYTINNTNGVSTGTMYGVDTNGYVYDSVSCNMPATDTTPPSTPVNVVANQAGASDATIAWDPSTDNVGVVSYQVHRSTSGANGLYDLMGTVGASPFTDSGLLGNVEYWYKIRAIDAANNLSAFSIEAYLYMLT